MEPRTDRGGCWANSAPPPWWNAGDSCALNGEDSHWALTLDDGANQSVYMSLIRGSLGLPFLHIRDNAADTGAEPNSTTEFGWESPDIWIRQEDDGKGFGQEVTGGLPSVVFVRVSNDGIGTYPADGNDIVRVLWSHGQSGLGWPAPWDGTDQQGGQIGDDQLIGVVLRGHSKVLSFAWLNTPDPAKFGSGNFCLLALILKKGSPTFAAFDNLDLNESVLRFNNVAWRNIYISAAPEPRRVGPMVAANHSGRDMLAQITYEVLDTAGRPRDLSTGKILISPSSAALERFRQHQSDRPFLEELGNGRFRVIDPAAGIPRLLLQPGEAFSFDLEYSSGNRTDGYAIRCVQYSLKVMESPEK
jgi:hypothetical protein